MATTQPSSNPSPNTLAPKGAGVGLPCANCKTYYSAELDACPICKSRERLTPATPAASLPDTVPDQAVIERERDKFLREFKSQVYTEHNQGPAVQTFRCSLKESHQGEFESATVCHTCYDRLQHRVDVLEAALLMDLKEATRIVYEAVWADSADPSKSYQNAAQALLKELRKRSGIADVLGPMQPLSH